MSMWDKLKFYALMALIAVAVVAVFTGLFFLKTYRWGSCP